MSKFHESKLNEGELIKTLQDIFKCKIVIKTVIGHACSFDVYLSVFDVGITGSQISKMCNELGDPDPMIIPDNKYVLRIIVDVTNKKYHVQNS
jgi:hypothetical protein